MEKHKNADGTYNGVKVLSELSGLPEKEMKSLWQQVQENSAKLSACQYHDFAIDTENKTMTREQYVCKNCGGTVNASMYRWHEIGRNSQK